eukprot:SAG11_NODE_221_length_12151_cov_5.633173_4_plen_467_part_00
MGLDPTTIVGVLGKLAKHKLPASLVLWVEKTALSFGRAKLVLQRGCHWVESPHRDAVEGLLADAQVHAAAQTGRIVEACGDGAGIDWASRGGLGTHTQSVQDARQSSMAVTSEFPDTPENSWVDDDALEAMMLDWEAVSGTEYDPRHQQQHDAQSGSGDCAGAPCTAGAHAAAAATKTAAAAAGASLGAGTASEVERLLSAQRKRTAAEAQRALGFAVKRGEAERLKQRCHELGCPLLEEYAFRLDTLAPSLLIEPKPSAQLRSYQEKALQQMFASGRARSGVVVLPCGAGKTLTGIMAALTIKKATLVLCVNSLSVEQWREQFMRYSTIDFADLHMLTAGKHPTGSIGPRPARNGDAARATVVITTYPMLAYGGQRSAMSGRALAELRRVEWGLLVLDEVHQVPATTFRRVISSCPAHTKLGLTATLVREDDKISDLNFLIGAHSRAPSTSPHIDAPATPAYGCS